MPGLESMLTPRGAPCARSRAGLRTEYPTDPVPPPQCGLRTLLPPPASPGGQGSRRGSRQRQPPSPWRCPVPARQLGRDRRPEAAERRAGPRATHLGRSPPARRGGPLRPQTAGPGTVGTPTPQPLASRVPCRQRSRVPPRRGPLVFSPRSSPRCKSPYFQATAWAPGMSSPLAVPSRQRSKQPAVLGAHQARLSRPPLLATTAQPPKGLPGAFRSLGGASALPF